MIIWKDKLSKIPTGIILLLIFVIGISLYANSLKNEFVWDDDILIQRNPSLQSNHIIDFFSGPIHKEFPSYYRPLQMISFKFDSSIWGLEPFGFHLTSILLHIFNAMLAYALAQLLLQNRLSSLLCALLFLIHPALSECVNFISSRSNLIALSFLLLSLIFYIKNERSKNRAFSIISISSFVISLFGHEVAMLFPVFLAFYELINNRKFQNATLHFLMLLAFIVLRLHFVPLAIYKTEVSRAVTLLTLPKIIFNDFKIMLFPVNLRKLWLIDTVKTAFSLEFLVYSLFIVGIVAMCRYLYKTSRPLLSGLIWFILMVFPILYPGNPLYGLPFISQGWLYVAALGIILITSEFLSRCISSFNKIIRISAISLACLIFITCTFLTMKQNKIWKTSISLLTNTVKYDTRQPYTLFCLGKAYIKAGDYTDALPAFENALFEFKKFDTEKTKYYLAEMYNFMATAYLKLNRYKEASVVLEKAYEINPHNSTILYKSAICSLMQRDIAKALSQCRKAIEIENNAKYTSLLETINSIGNHIKSNEPFTINLKIDIN